MGTKNDDSCLQKAGDDEPLFVLRAQDQLAPGLVREWARQAEIGGTPRAKVQEAYELAGRMEDWQGMHRAKHPD